MVLDLTITANSRLFAAVLFACISGQRSIVCPQEDLYTLVGLAAGYLPLFHTGDDWLASKHFHEAYWHQISDYIDQDPSLDDPGASFALALHALKLGWVQPFKGADINGTQIDLFMSLPRQIRLSYLDWDGSLQSFLSNQLGMGIIESTDGVSAAFFHVDYPIPFPSSTNLFQWHKLVGKHPTRSVKFPLSRDEYLHRKIGSFLEQFSSDGNYIDVAPVDFIPALAGCLQVSLSGGVVSSLDGRATTFTRSREARKILSMTSLEKPTHIAHLLNVGSSLPNSFKTLSGHHRISDIVDVVGNAPKLDIMAELMSAASDSMLNSIFSLSSDTVMESIPQPAKFLINLIRILVRRKRTHW